MGYVSYRKATSTIKAESGHTEAIPAAVNRLKYFCKLCAVLLECLSHYDMHCIVKVAADIYNPVDDSKVSTLTQWPCH